MKTTIKILFITMFFSIAIPSLLLSAEAKDIGREKTKKILKPTTKLHLCNLTTYGFGGEGEVPKVLKHVATTVKNDKNKN